MSTLIESIRTENLANIKKLLNSKTKDVSFSDFQEAIRINNEDIISLLLQFVNYDTIEKIIESTNDSNIIDIIIESYKPASDLYVPFIKLNENVSVETLAMNGVPPPDIAFKIAKKLKNQKALDILYENFEDKESNEVINYTYNKFCSSESGEGVSLSKLKQILTDVGFLKINDKTIDMLSKEEVCEFLNSPDYLESNIIIKCDPKRKLEHKYEDRPDIQNFVKQSCDELPLDLVSIIIGPSTCYRCNYKGINITMYGEWHAPLTFKQFNVNNKAGLPFAFYLKSLVTQNKDTNYDFFYEYVLLQCI